MCGISGILSLENRKISKRDLNIMNDMIIHRGPDSGGNFIEDNIALGNRRLAIIDLNASSDLPFFYKDQYVLVYNGEIYNYLELKDELISIGHSFITNSDSEVLLTSFVEWGEDCLEKFNGMWAFAIWDRKNKKLFCSRDRFGIKPFYWSSYNGNIYFGSEIKQIRKLNLGKRCNFEELSLFLYSGCTDSSSNTFFEGIQSLPPGHNLTVDRDGVLDINSWYSIRNKIKILNSPSDPDEFRFLLKKSIKLRMRSDVDICSSLSGGLDSSSIIALISELLSDTKSLKTLTAIHAKSSERLFDESGYAEMAAKSANCDFLLLEPSYDDFIKVMNHLIYFQDEPFASKSIFMQYFVMQKAKNIGCKVMLDGQGADEILLGYARFFLVTLFSYFGKKELMGSIKHLILSIRNNTQINPQNLIRYIFGSMNGNLRSRYSKYRMSFLNLSTESTRDLYKNIASAKYDPIESQIIEIEKNSLPQILRTEDRNSMAHSIEARVPFLDYNLVEYCLNLELAEKVKDGWTKYPIRNSKIIIDDLAWRKSKLGYDAPEDSWDMKYSSYMLDKVKNSHFIKQITNIKKLSNNWYKISSKERWRIFNACVWQEINRVEF